MTDERIIAYLLEELPEEQLEQFEDECFAEETWPEQLKLVEEDLIDAYLRNELEPERRERFKHNYLTTEAREERVIMAAALLRHVDERQSGARRDLAIQQTAPDKPGLTEQLRAFWGSRPWALRTALALGLVAILAGAWWFFYPRTRSVQTFATLTLNISRSDRAEGAQAGKVRLPLGADALRISLTLPAQLPEAVRYRAELDTESGETRSLEIAGHDAQSVIVVIPAAQLKRGQFALNLYAIKSDGTEQPISGSYFFIVE